VAALTVVMEGSPRMVESSSNRNERVGPPLVDFEAENMDAACGASIRNGAPAGKSIGQDSHE